MNRKSRERITALIFLITILGIGIKSKPYETAGKLFDMFTKSEKDEMSEEGIISLNDIKEAYVDTLWQKSTLIDINGTLMKDLDVRGYYSDIGIYVTEGQYIVPYYQQTSTDYEFEQLLSLKEYLDEKGINLLYVNAPIKYTDDTFMADEYGMRSYGNLNADILINRIREAGISCVDLRERLAEAGMNIYDMFYRTDHHWTTRSGLWATKEVAKALNQTCSYHIDLDVYDEEKYEYTEYKNCWLGEQGRRIAASYVGLDDFTVIKPNFDTNLILTTQWGMTEGTFDILINYDAYDVEADVYDIRSWHYSYLPTGVNQSVIHNNNVNEGKILLLGDSYSQVVVPFLSLGVSEIHSLILRSYNGDLRAFIEENEFDTVVVLYAQSMIGAHVNPDSANYKMFTFE